MNSLFDCLFVGAGGALGAVSRHLLSQLPVKTQSGFPVATLLINLLGAFAIGALAALAGKHSHLDPRLLLFLKVGVCGGFTTFSTFSLESVQLMQRGAWGTAVAYMTMSVVLCSVAVVSSQLAVS